MNKSCLLIVGGGSCTNVASMRLVEKLKPPTIHHPKPYKLHWLSEDGEIKVIDQFLLNFSIVKYKDEVLFDVVRMETSHVLLERPR